MSMDSFAHQTAYEACNTPSIDLPAAPDLRVDHSLTFCHEKECDVTLQIEPEAGEFRFSGLWLERKKKPLFSGELATKKSDDMISAWFGADHEFYDQLFVYAGYSDAGNCKIVSKLEITHNKERNLLEATIVAPNR